MTNNKQTFRSESQLNPNISCELRLPVVSYNLHDLAIAEHIGSLGVTANSSLNVNIDSGYTFGGGLHDSVVLLNYIEKSP